MQALATAQSVLKLPIFWLESADTDVVTIIDYIGHYDVSAAERLWEGLRVCVLPLSEHPYLYRISDRGQVACRKSSIGKE